MLELDYGIYRYSFHFLGKFCPRIIPRQVEMLRQTVFFNMWVEATRNKTSFKQECIPIGCVPAAH